MGFWDSFATAANSVENIRENTRKKAAFEALQKQYGDVAGDPDSAAKLQALSQQQGDMLRAAQLRAVSGLMSVPPERRAQAFKSIIAPNAAALGLSPDQAQQLGAQIEADPSTVDSLRAALLGPQKVDSQSATYLRNDKGDITGQMVYDDLGTPHVISAPPGTTIAAPGVGAAQLIQGPDGQYYMAQPSKFGGAPSITPLPAGAVPDKVRHEAVTESQGAQRVGIAQQNANTAASNASSEVANRQYVAPTAPPPGAPSDQAIAARIKQAGGIDAAIANAKTDGEAKAIADYAKRQADPLSALTPKGRDMALDVGQRIANGRQQIATIDKIIDSVRQQVSPYTAGPGSYLSYLSGTEAKNLQANLKTLGAQGLTQWINSQKDSSGKTGIGKILQSEVSAAQASFGALEQEQTPKMLLQHLGIFQQRMHEMQNTAEQAFENKYHAKIDKYFPAASTGHLSDKDLLAKYGVK